MEKWKKELAVLMGWNMVSALALLIGLIAWLIWQTKFALFIFAVALLFFILNFALLMFWRNQTKKEMKEELSKQINEKVDSFKMDHK
ncbi:hypothetical protein [Latilactobacillus phage TMW 1.1381 P1]|uniref:hypothetical protein n=1 Tax=Latilactobacillus curvatus TaxID=28038 RepID=UPI0009756C42|nr:hypothetical protein [Latilactobacillus curvatus]WEU69651.1 hypothetical protein [Latilactobacillus phage TMW 1.1381 P1]MCT3525921.1 hypothetical protein [Latilactobacillus curvatus]UTB70114.1 hypothetical protein A4W71_02955 [Latilactobacillus curvatus]UTB74640.1 hypothetical protein A4W73_07145 [Latilactobacillus curvatus]UTY80446.1 hypothetical protein A4W76_07145 [Latilactobacillus curvatus]